MSDITIPQDLWEDDSPGVIASWLYANGDAVSQGEVIAEVMNEKVSFEIEAPASGSLEIMAEAESEVTLGQVIGRITG